MTQEGRRACEWKSTSKQVGREIGKSVSRKAEMRWGASGDRSEGAGTKLSRKASSEDSGTRTETDTGRQDENSKVRGKTLDNEPGKIHPELREKENPDYVKSRRAWSVDGLQKRGPSDCLPQTQASAKAKADV